MLEGWGQKWSGSIEMPFFTEAGSAKGMVGTLLKHFFGDSSSAENGSTGQHFHMLYPKSDPFSTSNLGDKALTLNLNINEGASMKNWPFVGARVSSLNFDQDVGSGLKVSADLFGQFKDTTTAEIGSASFAAENLRCDYNNLTVYTGTITRTGTAPDYTDFSFGSATQIKPDKISVKIENGMEDVVRLCGTFSLNESQCYGLQSTLPKSNSHKSNNRLSRRSFQVLFFLYSIVFNPS